MLETHGRIEPCFFEELIPVNLADLSVEIQRDATRLGQGLHPDSAAELADLVRVMNCYYSNLIEGHNTRPRDIERALLTLVRQLPIPTNIIVEHWNGEIDVAILRTVNHTFGDYLRPTRP